MKYLLIICFALFTCNFAKADISKEDFKVLNNNIVKLDKDLFNIFGNPPKTDCGNFDCKVNGGKGCKDCNCDCKETGKCECDKQCPKKNPLEVKEKPSISYEKFYNHIENGGTGTLYVGTFPHDVKAGTWCHLATLKDTAPGVYECYLENGIHYMKLKVAKAPMQNSCPTCPNYVPFGNGNCPNGQCPRR